MKATNLECPGQVKVLYNWTSGRLLLWVRGAEIITSELLKTSHCFIRLVVLATEEKFPAVESAVSTN